MPLLDIPEHLVIDARMFSCRNHDVDAVCAVLSDYGNVIGELRKLRSRLAQLDEEGAQLDARVDALQLACRRILEL